MPKEKAPRNRTIDIPLEDGQCYLSRCITISEKVNDINSLLDKTICGDTFSVIPNLPQNSVDLLIADPPYNMAKSFGKMKFAKQSEADYESYTRKWLSAVRPLIKKGGSVYVCCDWETSLIVGRVLGDYFTVRNRITWQREKGRGAMANWKNSLEDIWFATNGDNYTFNIKDVKLRKKVLAPYRADGKPKDWVSTEYGKYRDTCPSNFWDDITIPFWSMPENTPHPTQKPEKLIAKLILASSNPGDLVFDPFLGSGTTSVVAKKTDRKYLGIEVSEEYCVWAEKRLEAADDDRKIQGYENGVFFERNSLPPKKTPVKSR